MRFIQGDFLPLKNTWFLSRVLTEMFQKLFLPFVIDVGVVEVSSKFVVGGLTECVGRLFVVVVTHSAAEAACG